MTKRQKKLLTRIIIAAVIYIAGIFLPLEGIPQLTLYLLCYAVIGWDIVWKAITNITHGQIFDENFLMTIATVGALVLGEYSEGVAVMLFYQIGEWFQSYAVSKSRKSITNLMDIRPDYANVAAYILLFRLLHSQTSFLDHQLQYTRCDSLPAIYLKTAV